MSFELTPYDIALMKQHANQLYASIDHPGETESLFRKMRNERAKGDLKRLMCEVEEQRERANLAEHWMNENYEALVRERRMRWLSVMAGYPIVAVVTGLLAWWGMR